MNNHKRFEVWLHENGNGTRCNARFESRDRAESEVDWYRARGYSASVRRVDTSSTNSNGKAY